MKTATTTAATTTNNNHNNQPRAQVTRVELYKEATGSTKVSHPPETKSARVEPISPPPPSNKSITLFFFTIIRRTHARIYQNRTTLNPQQIASGRRAKKRVAFPASCSILVHGLGNGTNKCCTGMMGIHHGWWYIRHNNTTIHLIFLWFALVHTDRKNAPQATDQWD